MELNPRMPFQMHVTYIPPTEVDIARFPNGFLQFTDQTGEATYRLPIILENRWLELHLLIDKALRQDLRSQLNEQTKQGTVHIHSFPWITIRMFLGQTDQGLSVSMVMKDAESRDYLGSLLILLRQIEFDLERMAAGGLERTVMRWELDGPNSVKCVRL